MPTTTDPCFSSISGFSLLEMLITLSLFSIILLVLGTGQFRDTQKENHLYFERIALNITHNAYEQSYSGTQDDNALNSWLKEVSAEQLPEGDGYLFNDTHHLMIEISWTDRINQENKWHVDI